MWRGAATTSCTLRRLLWSHPGSRVLRQDDWPCWRWCGYLHLPAFLSACCSSCAVLCHIRILLPALPSFFSQALTNTEFHLGVQHWSGEATGVGSVAATLFTNITPPWAFWCITGTVIFLLSVDTYPSTYIWLGHFSLHSILYTRVKDGSNYWE